MEKYFCKYLEGTISCKKLRNDELISSLKGIYKLEKLFCDIFKG